MSSKRKISERQTVAHRSDTMSRNKL